MFNLHGVNSTARNKDTVIRILVCKKLPVHSGDPTPPTPPHPPILSSALTLSARLFSHELASRTLPVSRVGFGLWSPGLSLHQACLPGCPLETRSKLPFLLGFLPQRITLKTLISLRVRSCCRPSPTPGSKTSLASPSSPRVMLTPPTLPPQPGDATCQATSWPP